jgi:hypothetical protein
MSKLILMSMIFAIIAIPVRLSREADAKKAIPKLIKQMLLYGLFYMFALRYLWGRFD